MNNSNLTEFKNDFNNLLRCEDIMEKYKISKTTYHTIVRRLGLKRPKTSKILRTFNMSFADDKPKETEQKAKANYIPIDDVYGKRDETDERLVYSKQYVPRGTKLDIEKKAKVISKPKPKPVVKEQIEEPKKDESNNKSELLNAINRSTKVREKILNKKNNS
jgi:hypothetical protein